MNFKNIKIRLLFWYSVTLFFILLSFSLGFIYISYEQNIKIVDTNLAAVVNDINHDIVKKYNNDFSEEFDEDEEFVIKNLFISIYEKENNFKILSSNHTIDIQNNKLLDKNQFYYFTVNDAQNNKIRVVRLRSDKLDKNIYIEAATTLNDKINKPLNNLKNTLFILVPVTFIFSIIIGYFIIRNSLKPVKSVIDKVNTIEVEDLKKRIDTLDSKDEIDELINTFNSMLQRLDESVAKIKRFSNDVSHELKTPLTVIRGEMEIGLRKDRSVDEYKKIISSSLEETKDLQQLIENLLFLSNANHNELIETFDEIDIDELIIDIISQNNTILNDKNIEIELTEFKHCIKKGNIHLLKILFRNLFQNAIKYSNKNSKIEITLTEDIFNKR
ncbi:MAG: histidine kinase dimerization/phospho-acceptor domain-containing protein [Campylobacterota bacterium]|nr:histidine kinase dimerization/phospho-acceptor domain-containing protein [Campylobacterota bacterium]